MLSLGSLVLVPELFHLGMRFLPLASCFPCARASWVRPWAPPRVMVPRLQLHLRPLSSSQLGSSLALMVKTLYELARQSALPVAVPRHPRLRILLPFLLHLTTFPLLDYGHSEDEWLGVAGSDLYDPNNAYATSGEEGEVPVLHSHSRSVYSSPLNADSHRDPPPVELSPSVALEDFVELPPRVSASLAEAPVLRRGTHTRGPFRDPALAMVPELSVGRTGLQPAPRIRSSHHTTAEQRGRSHRSDPHRQLRPRACTRETSPGPDFGSHLHRSSQSLSPAAHYAPARLAEQRVPVKNGRRFRDPRQGEISSSVPAAMLNQVNPLVISALRSGWPAFISLNYFS
ncbi:hypothetical protein C8R41DRAFT_870839 [Lentinula lateritia]|uniref:Uncharacterized protein n=1 Tax=Lentinula lateritia TaxID=40482 RepID=A0ABQ8V1X6_9AGAR|nr:hypothetical protein C8R41DRAFT_870839 [Lentinula lateritia]